MDNQIIRFIAPVYHLHTSEVINDVLFEGAKLCPPGFFASTELFNHRIFRLGVGQLNIETLNQNVILYFESPLFKFQNLLASGSPHQLSIDEIGRRLYTEYEHFFKYLWFVDDNSTYIDHGYTTSEKGLTIHNSLNAIECSTGFYLALKISKDDIEYMHDVTTKMLGHIYKPINIIAVVGSDQGKVYKSTYLHNRLIRALIALGNARKSELIISRIAFYIMLLECIFLFEDNVEISHKVSERMALYLGDDSAEKYKIYTDIKLAYSIRSKFVHGQKLTQKKKNKSDVESIIEFVKELDATLRRLFRKILESEQSINFFLQEDEVLTKYFTKLIFEEKPIGPISS